MNLQNKSCCVFGHRKIEGEKELKEKLTKIIEELIIFQNVDTFYLGSKSDFDTLCRKVLSKLKKKHPHIKRVYVRAEYPYISKSYEKYLLKNCEETYFPETALNSGRAVYVIRNFEMIDKSEFCIVYFKEDYLPESKTKSGTKIAYNYATEKKRTIINLA